MERKVRTFRAQRPNGEVVLIDEYQEFIDSTSYGSPAREWTPGLKRLEREGGGAVNFINETTFFDVARGEELTTGK